MQQLDTRPLSVDQIPLAYPLVQAALPQVTLDAWRGFAAKQLSGQDPPVTGILTVASPLGCLTGLCSYRVDESLLHGRTLTIDNFVAVDLLDRGAIAETLAMGVEGLAQVNHCTAIHINLIRPAAPDDPAGLDSRSGRRLIDLLSGRGHRVHSIGLCKPLMHR